MPMKRTLLAMGLALTMVIAGCGTPREEPTKPPVTVPAVQPVTPPNPPDTTSDYQAKIKQAEKEKAEAISASNRLAQLQAERDEAMNRAALAKEEAKIKAAEAAQWQGVVKSKEVEIRVERENILATKLYWVVGILGLLALVATVVAIWQPLVRRFAGGFAIACASVATIAFFLAVYIHYIIWVGGGLVAIGVVAAVIYMRRSDKAVIQMASAVESVKDKIGPEFKQIFKSHIDSDAEAHIDAARNRVKTLADKVAQSKFVQSLKAKVA